jgi:hypothetical protein
MPLACPAYPGNPLAHPAFGGDTSPNVLNPGLKSREIPLWTKPKNTPTVRTPAPLHLDCMPESIKTNQHKTVTPYPASVAKWTSLRLRPRIISSHINKLLEIRIKRNYHHPHLFENRLAGMVSGAVALLKRRPFPNKKAPKKEAHLF